MPNLYLLKEAPIVSYHHLAQAPPAPRQPLTRPQYLDNFHIQHLYKADHQGLAAVESHMLRLNDLNLHSQL